MYRRSKFLEVLHRIREEMSREADYDVDLFAEMVRSGKKSSLVFPQPSDDPTPLSDLHKTVVSDQEH